MTAPIAVIGDLAVDIVVRLHGEIATGSDTASSNRLSMGGGGANVAAWIASTGAPVDLVGRVGDDVGGRWLREDLAGRGVTPHLATDPDRPTGTIVAIATPDGERTMYPDRGANLGLEPEDVPEALVAGAALLHISGYSLLHGGPRQAALEALAVARAHDVVTCVDLSSAAPLAAVGPAAFRTWTRGVTICRGNLAEARVLTGEEEPMAAARQLAESYPVGVVTLGAAGACAVARGAEHHVPAEAATLVDSVGAGDAFTAGLLVAWAAGAHLDASLHGGAALAARAVGLPGGSPPLTPHRAPS